MWAYLLETGSTGAPKLIEWVFAGLGVFVAALVGRISLMRGRREGPQTTVGEIAGAIIDRDAADEVVAAIRKNAEATRAAVRAMEALGVKLEAATEQTRQVDGTIDEARREIRELTREIVARGRV